MRKGMAGILLALLIFSAAPAQTLPLLTDAEYRYLVNEISGDIAYEHIRYFTLFHRPRGGTEGLMRVAEYAEQKAREYGLEDVRLIKQPYPLEAWKVRRAELWMIEPEWQRLADFLQTHVHVADNSRSADVRAELVDVGAGLEEKDYVGKDVRGKIVLAYGSLDRVMEEAVWKRGALGIVYYPDPSATEYPLNSINFPDQIRWVRIPLRSADGKEGTFAFSLSLRQGLMLRRRLAQGPVKVHARIEAEVLPEKWQVMVEGFIRGTEIPDQDIVLTAHLQEEKFSANDNASGCAGLLEIARALTKLIREGKIRRPRRNIRFWWVTEISGPRQYFADHPDEPRRMLVNINLDMIGANQGQDLLRVQNITRVPFSRSHFLTDVAERVVEFVVTSNTSQLAQFQAGSPFPYPKPILAHLGTRHRYNAQMIPFHNNTDHMTFNEAPIGVPGITFTNWPDNYIHTTDDDLWNIDRTQLQRNTFAAAAIAYFIASLDAERGRILATEVFTRALERMAFDERLAFEMVLHEPDKTFAFGRARNQILQAAARERLALESILRPVPEARGLVEHFKTMLAEREAQALSNLERYYVKITGQARAPSLVRSPKEEELARKIPVLAAGPAEFLERRHRVRNVEGLHPLMAFEVLNFIDGSRSVLDIYNAVDAEARRAGAHYYGTVTLERVEHYVRNLIEAGLVRWKL
ncbi:MAG: M28 family metallopeptidase [Blastocatellia bacterium]|nr:M28 family metallopeptidase [Blastocatellia bacterium]MCS7156780.1 M28 family metallopeptidase [Blastocatellia bacterium]MCX7752738.1 M28 family metallopeptidase [Blastocatellia bacterium]MDW8167470.1 M28 family peptidase [Acidobacteriota bacterium]MDW8256817.1 M28 family peptidase [Acidobacteriota bacterium]